VSGSGLDPQPTRPPRLRPSELLIARLRAEHGLALPNAELRRTYASRADRSTGAWLWTVEADDWRTLRVGSMWSVTRLLKCRHRWDVDRDQFGDTSVDPCPACQKA